MTDQNSLSHTDNAQSFDQDPLLVGNGDYCLNIAYPRGLPTLVPSPEVETRLSFNPYQTAQACADQSDDLHFVPAVHIHAFHTHILPEYLDHLSRSLVSVDLYITTDTVSKQFIIQNLLRDNAWACKQNHTLLLVENRGRNVSALFRDAFSHLSNYSCVLHLHTKVSEESDLGESWREHLLTTLLPGQLTGVEIVKQFHLNPELGLFVPTTPNIMRKYQNWGDNYDAAMLLSSQLWPNRQLCVDAPLSFPVGMMFWFRPRALQRLASALNHQFQWPFEPLAWDGTSLHAIERLICHCVEAEGFRWTHLALQDPPADRSCPSQPELVCQEHHMLSVWTSHRVQYLILCAQVVHQFRSCIEELTASRQALTASRQALTASRQALTASRQALTASRQELLDQQTLHERVNSHKSREIEQWKSACQDLQSSSLAKINQVQEAANQSIQALHQSMSWRVTKPLRLASRLFRVVFRRSISR